MTHQTCNCSHCLRNKDLVKRTEQLVAYIDKAAFFQSGDEVVFLWPHFIPHIEAVRILIHDIKGIK